MNPAERWKLVLELAVFAVGISVACIYYKQWKVMENTMVNGQRAWILLDKAQVVANEATGDVVLRLSLKNVGQTPALDADAVARFGVTRRPLSAVELREAIPFDESWSQGTTIGPGQEIGKRIPLSASDLEQVRVDVANGGRLYIRALTQYRDVFGFERRSWHCLEHDGGVREHPLNLIFNHCESPAN